MIEKYILNCLKWLSELTLVAPLWHLNAATLLQVRSWYFWGGIPDFQFICSEKHASLQQTDVCMAALWRQQASTAADLID